MISVAPPRSRQSQIQLRDYQLEAIEAVNDADVEGVRRPLVALPTGTGKTIVFAQMINERPGRALVLVHRDELIRQAVEKLLMVNPEFDIGVVKSGENEVSKCFGDRPDALRVAQVLLTIDLGRTHLAWWRPSWGRIETRRVARRAGLGIER